MRGRWWSILLVIVTLGAATLLAAAPSRPLAARAPTPARACNCSTSSSWSPPAEQPETSLGFDVAYSDGVSVAGAPYRTVGGNASQGSAFVFRHYGELYVQDELTAGDGTAGDLFGYGTAVSGARSSSERPAATSEAAPIKAPSTCSATPRASGRSRPSSPRATARPATGSARSSASRGDTIAVTAANKQVGGNPYQGAVYIFTRSGDTWTQEAMLAAADGQAYDALGFTLAVDGDTVVAGAMNHEVDGHPGQGASYVFARSGGGWSQQAMLTANNGEAGDAFGWTNGIDGDTVVVGAFAANGGVRRLVRLHPRLRRLEPAGRAHRPRPLPGRRVRQRSRRRRRRRGGRGAVPDDRRQRPRARRTCTRAPATRGASRYSWSRATAAPATTSAGGSRPRTTRC